MGADRTTVRLHPTREDSFPLGHDDLGSEELGAAGYVETELFVSGTAAGERYTTRALLRAPENVALFSGVVLVEPMHWMGVRSVWRAARRYFLRQGHAWAEIACQSTAPRRLKQFDPSRYADIALVDGARDEKPSEARIGDDAGAARTLESVRRESDAFRATWRRANVQSPEIIAQFARAVRDGLTPLTGVTQVFLSGLSQSGGIARAFAAEHHARFSADGAVFDGYLPMSSGGDALPDLDVPVIELLGESELEELRAQFLLPGQVRGLSHRRADSAHYRLYEVAGMAHTDSRDDPAPGPPARLPAGQRWSRFPNAHVVHVALDSLVRWARDGVAAPPGRLIETDEHGRIVRDRHGHARGGLRSPHLDVPLARVSAIAGAGREWACGSEEPFASDTLRTLYGSESAYRSAAAARLAELGSEGYYLPDDAADYLARATWADEGAK